MRRLAAALLALSCVEVDDLRVEPPVVPVGQVDTGWQPDAGGPMLPETIACHDDAECGAWLSELPCLTARCTSGQCVADPVSNGTPCTDGDFRTHGDRCLAGRCESGPPVCACAVDADCAAFDDGNACNGRLACDGCVCAPVATPAGSPCDDGDPATTGDACNADGACAGTVPCQCTKAVDCGAVACVETVCADCQCRTFAAEAGLVYAAESFDGGLPAGWSSSTDNGPVTWSAKAGVLRAVGPDGTYDHGPTTATLTASPELLPPGAAILRLSAGLWSAEEGCGDRLELRIDDAVVATLCGPTAPETLTFIVAPDHAAVLSAVFVSDGDENAAAGPIVDDVRWLRVAPDACVKPVETALPASGVQRAPDVGEAAGGWVAAWEGEAGVYVRAGAVDAAGLATPSAPATLVGPGGRRPAVGGDGLVAWEQGPDGARRIAWVYPDGLPTEVADADDAHHVDADGTTLVYLTELGGLAVHRLDLGGTPAIVAGPDPSLRPPRVAVDGDGAAHVLVASDSGVALDGDPLGDPGVTSRPALAAGHGLLVGAWTTMDGVHIRTMGGAPVVVAATSAAEPDLAPTGTGWLVVWTAPGNGGADTNVVAVALGAALESQTQLPPLATYTFDDQDTVRLAPAGAGAIAVWHTPWFDGDASGVVVRSLEGP